MKKQDYNVTITVKATAKEAFKNINSVSKWWTENLEGSLQKLNDVFTVYFGETFVTFKIIEVVPDKKIVWLVTDCYLHWLKDKKDWKGTKIVFEILEQKDSTKIIFTHVGLVPEIECYNDCIKGWDQYIKGSLFKLISEGKGLPEKQKSLA
ncbi:MAG: SRPBCC domain-containing protein [Chitinophagaceae bacterium]